MTTLLNGQKILDGVFQGGSVGLPSMRFVNSLTNGFYYIGTNNIGLSLNGVKTWDFGTALSATIAPVSFSAGIAVTAAGYWIGRDADATNQLHLNVPTGASFELSVNDVAQVVLSTTALTITPPVTINNTLVVSGYATTISVNGIAATSTDGLVLQNTTDSTVGVPVQYSPRQRFHAEVWDTDGSNDTFDFITEVIPTSASTTLADLTWSRSKSGAAYAALMSLDETGNLQLLQSAGKFFVANGSGMEDNLWGGLLLNTASILNLVGTNNSGTPWGGAYNFLAATITAGAAGQYGIALTQTLNDAATAGGETYTMWFSNLTETNKTGWPTVNLMDLQVGATSKFLVSDGGVVSAAGAIIGKQGTDIASGTTIVIPTDGNTFELTGTTAVTLITTTGYRDGHEITFVANESVVITNGTATSGANVTIKLAGAGNFSMTADDTLTLVLSTTTAGAQAWREKNRSVN